MADQRFPKSRRLLKRAEFKAVFDGKQVRKDGRLVAYVRAGTGPETRLGIVVGRAARRSVPRNRIKRLIREGFRALRETLPTGMDVIVLPRQGARLTLEGVKQSLTFLLTRPPTPEPGGAGTKPGPKRKSKPGASPGPGRGAKPGAAAEPGTGPGTSAGSERSR